MLNELKLTIVRKLFLLFWVQFFLMGAMSASNIDQQFFTDTDALLKKHVTAGRVDYAQLKADAELKRLVERIEQADLKQLEATTKKAFLINAYNLLVLHQAAEAYPIESVQDIAGFFDRQKVKVAGKSYTLTQFEKKELLTPYKDARLHFVLNCAAISCPPITNFAYQPDLLEAQLDRQTQLALDDPNFLKVTEEGVELSQIFSWYLDDFGGTRATALAFINKYRTTPIDESSKVSYYNYDWTLNDVNITTSDIGNNAARYVVSSTIPKGSVEVKVFNNLYTERTGGGENLTNRSTFLTTSLSFLYGVNNRLNVGFATRYRRVRNDLLPSSAFDVLGNSEAVSARQGVTAFGPQFRYAPFQELQNFSIQSSFVFPVGTDLAGNATQPYIDWNGATWITQFFNDFSIGNNFSVFTELDFWWEDIGQEENGNINRIATPAVVIFSYFPNSKTTLYALGGYAPFWQENFDYFAQAGLGFKYQFNPNLEIELLWTEFTTKFLSETSGQANTYNLGLRFNL